MPRMKIEGHLLRARTAGRVSARRDSGRASARLGVIGIGGYFRDVGAPADLVDLGREAIRRMPLRADRPVAAR